MIKLDGIIVLVVLVTTATPILIAFARLPRWFAGSMGRHAMWKMRDDVVLDVIEGRLPRNEPCVAELVARVQWAVTEAKALDLLHTRVWSRARRNIPKSMIGRYTAPPLGEVTDPYVAHLVDGYRQRYDSIAIQTTFLSSWVGLAIVSRYAVPVLFKLTARHVSIRAAVFSATSEAVADTTIGQQVRDMVDTKGPENQPIAA